ncbi:MAG TPA: hypothetical protein PLC42_07405 [Parachlamydiaceae bacterium]|nr:hypothetical protein [Parachlamydiaceae bacterium]
MCFSETASLTAAAVLAVQGAASVHLAKRKKTLLLLGAIPLFFAVQQFAEGIIWHFFNQGWDIAGLARFASYVFLFFAFLIWPVAIPLSLWIAEPLKFRRKILLGFTVAGCTFAAYLFVSFFHLSITVENSGRSILYGEANNYFSSETESFLKAIYMTLLMVPIFISSLRLIWLFGFLSLVSALIAHYFYHEAFTSVWCFFAALLSLVLYRVIQENIES